MNKNKIEAGKKHTCQECGSSFSRPYRLIQHMLLHNNIKAFACGEENCNKSYTSKSHLDRHILSVHIKRTFEVINRCPECMKMFSNRQNLKRHIKIKHMSKKERFFCDVCHADFKKKHLLTSHMYQHTFVKSFSCNFCPKDFVTLHEKKKHQKYHKTYNCELCDMTFSHWSKYLKHKQAEHCIKEYTCNECGRTFKQRQHIVRHVKIHMSQPLFKCWYKDCNRLYTRHSNLRQHIRVKHLDITYPCEICGFKLCTKQKLLAHLQQMHKNEPVALKHPTLAEGRKERRDKGSAKTSTALKIAGLHIHPICQLTEYTSESQEENKTPCTKGCSFDKKSDFHPKRVDNPEKEKVGIINGNHQIECQKGGNNIPCTVQGVTVCERHTNNIESEENLKQVHEIIKIIENQKGENITPEKNKDAINYNIDSIQKMDK